MHILVISQQWLPETGVAQQRLNDLTQTMRQHGHTVSVVTAPPHFPDGKLLSTLPQHQSRAHEKTENGLDIYRTHFREHSKSLASRIIDQGIELADSIPVGVHSIRNTSPDLILASAPPLPSIITSTILAKRYKIPYVIDLRDAWPDLIPFINQADPYKTSVGRKLLPYALKPAGTVLSQAIGSADGIITTTNQLAEELNARCGVRTQVIRNLPTSPQFQSIPAPNLDDPELKVAYNGTLGRAQGLSNILDAVEILQQRDVKIHVTLRGRGAHTNYLREEAHKRNLPVHIRQPISHQEVIESYVSADTALVSLQNWHPLSLTVPSKLYELLAIGRHITLCGAGESACLLEESQAGDVVPPMNPEALADLWERLQNNRSLLNVGNRGSQWLNQHPSRQEEMHQAVSFLENTVGG